MYTWTAVVLHFTTYHYQAHGFLGCKRRTPSSLTFFDTIKYEPDRAIRTFSKLQIHDPGSDQLYSGVQQLSMYTQNILNCSACPKTKILETKCKQRIGIANP